MIEYLILGIIQGITEWVPISSEAQILIAAKMFGMHNPLKLAVWLHLGTCLAAAVYFRSELKWMVQHIPDWINPKKRKFANETQIKRNQLMDFILVSTAITGIIGAPLYFIFESQFKESTGAILLAIVGMLLVLNGIIQKSAENKQTRRRELSIKDSVITGIAQGFSALPGISRSGTTTSALLILGHDSTTALRLSFIISIFSVGSAQIGLQIVKGFELSQGAIIAVLASFITGLLGIDVLLRITRKIKFWKFCILLGLLSMFPLVREFIL